MVNFMKKVICVAVSLSLFGVTFAENSHEEQTKHEVYIGTGASIAHRETDFTLNNMSNYRGADDMWYHTTHFSDRSNKYNGQLFAGYRYVHSSLFLAFEINCLLNNSKTEKTFSKELDFWEDHSNSAKLSIKRKNELSFLLKIGHHALYNITPYAILGMCARHMEYDFSYIPPSIAAAPGIPDYSVANRNFRKRKSKLVYGVGLSFALEDRFNFRMEYTCSKFGSLDHSEILGTAPVYGAQPDPIDKNGLPRFYSFKNKMQHNLSIGISRSFSW